MVEVVENIENREIYNEVDSRWNEIHEKHLLYLFPQFVNIAYLSEEEMITLCGGKYIYDLGHRYVDHNESGRNIDLLAHDSQFNLDRFYARTRYNELCMIKNANNRELMERYHARQKEINRGASNKNQDPYLVLKVNNIVSRHGRSDPSKSKRKYSVYVAFDEKSAELHKSMLYLFPHYIDLKTFFIQNLFILIRSIHHLILIWMKKFQHQLDRQ